MRKSRFSEAQIIGMIKEQEAGILTADVCRKHGLSQGTFYKFKSQYGGMSLRSSGRRTLMRLQMSEGVNLSVLVNMTGAGAFKGGFRSRAKSSSSARPPYFTRCSMTHFDLSRLSPVLDHDAVIGPIIGILIDDVIVGQVTEGRLLE